MENSTDEIPIYNPDLLKQLDYAALTNLKYSTPRSPQNPGNSLIMRPLCAADYHKGFIELLRQLTSVGDVTPEQFMGKTYFTQTENTVAAAQRLGASPGAATVQISHDLNHFQQMKSCNGTYYITVIEDISISKIVAAATLVVERKYIHACATRGMIEEVVVDSGYRGQQLGKLLMDTLTLLSKHTLGCYKTTLQCTEENIPFYEKFGFKKDPQVYMQHRHKP